MRIGLISDTHGWLDERVFHHFKDCDEVWHAGDIGDVAVLKSLESFKLTRAVFGNIDGTDVRNATHEHLRWTCEGMVVWMTHIGGRPGNYSIPVRNSLHTQPPDIFICGHSHICLVQKDPALGCLYMNPGAAGKHGFHKVRTLLKLTIQSGLPKDLVVIELGPRT
jgi:uncharacterized protein